MPNTLVATECLECDAVIPWESDTRVGEIVECPECRIELEVESVDPPQLIVAPEVEEDWGE
ncbi:lysine biosynthesis protein LysW [Streptomyces spiroverticillatus]|uniref:Lysine biosynthesis protein LysW n=1 Tax=Streptomyces finlayi TaxID=67296 RepID=A0A918X4F0_9ACTN|nr:lysine biosynthesis protein LysW [Streptomyces finlayi]GHA31867.1 lysine biosynthesis protein LysW [Streptomyces spiroverticillatus]GHD10856.1 lysine biosynthesis protein LysW [Streptomyces finlayi]